MRKYWRLLLMVVATVSVLAMIIFRHKYINLTTVVEMMKIVSKQPDKPLGAVHYFNNSTVEMDINSWQEIFPNIYIYSSYATSNGVISFGFTNQFLTEELEKIACRLWFDDFESGNTIKTVHLLNEEKTLFYLTCTPTSHLGIPYAITFYKEHISSSLPVNLKPKVYSPYTACLKIDPAFADKYKLLEFMIYYSNIGVKNFRMYYTTMSHTVQKLLLKVAGECGINIKLLSWITPPGFKSNSLNLQPFFIECLFHATTHNHSDFLLLLDLNDFIFLEENSSLKTVTSSKISTFDYFQLEKFSFCSEFPNDVIAQALNIHFKILLKNKMSMKNRTLTNVIYNISSLKQYIWGTGSLELWLQKGKSQKFQIIKPSSASIFSYGDCGQKAYENSTLLYIQNSKMWKYKNAIFSSCAYIQAQKLSIID